MIPGRNRAELFKRLISGQNGLFEIAKWTSFFPKMVMSMDTKFQAVWRDA